MQLDAKAVLEIFDRHPGEQAKLARRLKRSKAAVSLVLRGREVSKYISDAARERALKLLEDESKAKAKKGAG